MLAILESSTFWTGVAAILVSLVSVGSGLILGRWKKNSEEKDAFRADFSLLIKELKEERALLRIQVFELRARVGLCERALLAAGIDLPTSNSNPAQ